MPIEIRELVIKTTINDSPLQSNSRSEKEGVSKAQLLQLKKDIVRDCVRVVLEKLRDKTRRL